MADHKMAFSLIIVFIFAVVGGALSLVFSNFLHFSQTSGISSTAPASPPGSLRAVYNPPSPQEAPEAIRDAVLLGYNLMVDTRKYAAAYVGDKLRCAVAASKAASPKAARMVAYPWWGWGHLPQVPDPGKVCCGPGKPHQ